MTDFIAHIVRQGDYYRVALTPVSKGGASPITATAWAEQDGRIFEADAYQEAEAFIGQLPGKFWSDASSPLPGLTAVHVAGGFAGDPLPPGKVEALSGAKKKPQKHSAKSQRLTR